MNFFFQDKDQSVDSVHSAMLNGDNMVNSDKQETENQGGMQVLLLYFKYDCIKCIYLSE